MAVYKFNIMTKSIRPIIRHPDYKDFQLLFDTGAVSPVWTSGKETFDIFFPDAIKIGTKKIKGFGGDGQCGECYLINFKLGNLVLPRFKITIIDGFSLAAHMVFPVTAFYGGKYTIDNVNHTFVFETEDAHTRVRYLKEYNSKGDLVVMLQESEVNYMLDVIPDAIKNQFETTEDIFDTYMRLIEGV